MQTTFKKADALIAALCLVVAILLVLLPMLRQDDVGDILTVTYRDGKRETYSLGTDQILTLHGNSHTLTVVIENGTVYVRESDCPDGLCRAGHISRDGETLVCLPAGIVLSVKSNTGGEIDAVVG